MYETHYGLSGKPFQLTPDPGLFVETDTHARAMAYLTYGLAQNEGFVVVTGDVGTGKTTLIGHLVATKLPGDTIVGSIVTSQVDADSMLKLAMAALGIDGGGDRGGAKGGGDKADHLRAVETFLKTQAGRGKRVILIVDEAQNLSFGALEELRMLSNFQDGSRPLIQIVLLGQPEFRQTVTNAPELEQLRQRVIASHHIEPMPPEDVATYIRERLTKVGWTGRPSFSDGAMAAIAQGAGGVPRMVNTLASRAMLFASLDERDDIDAELVEDVIDDLRSDNALPARPSTSLFQAGAQDGELTARLDRIEERLDRHGRVMKQLIGLVNEMLVEESAERRAGEAGTDG
ncbi:MAG: AAA family ATPase [Pacificimonas sp.]|jgi:type II secretory pathway predicted ATPase ExeA|nr:AAA family ATPase [Pacificimonas sp.]